jgi:hypothetical protein
VVGKSGFPFRPGNPVNPSHPGEDCHATSQEDHTKNKKYLS